MIEAFEYPQYELRPGDTYHLKVVAPEPIAVKIKCFKSSPPPPGYRSCEECGSFRVRSGETLFLSVSETAFREVTGGIDVTVEDRTGDSRQVRLVVATEEEDRGQSMMAGEA
jgi:hypothetical protein